MFVIATLAAIVASQSLISATFSVIKQSVVLDYFPRVKVVHTSQQKEGEVYSPEVNYILMVLCVSVILGFGGGKEIGNAFGKHILQKMLQMFIYSSYSVPEDSMQNCLLQVLLSSWSCS
jgi:KUP system potassium uptake protein